MNPNLAAAGKDQAEEASGPKEMDPKFSLKQRLALWLISWSGYLAIRLIGATLRPSFTYEPGSENEPRTRPAIYCFWHRCVFAAGYLFRDHEIRVLTSRSYDGEYIARIIERLGFRAVRGSSSRGAVQSLRELQREVEVGEYVAFTIDGPRGPRYVAKPGPIHLARVTGAAIFCFYVAPERAWVLKSWDAFMIPKPFSRVHVYVRSPIRVSPDADHDAALAHLQTDLEEARHRAEARFTKDAKQDTNGEMP
ncbi:MAG TPA: lysophospholipid acyltransferase family protein [Terriglobales bacterium]|nr:lysophospholipid acyltransferase family protein [Terriglobales bacterium]